MKKRLICVFLTSTMLWGSIGVYAQDEAGSSLPEGTVTFLDSDESVSSQAVEAAEIVRVDSDEEEDAQTENKDEETSSAAISAYAVDTNYLEIDQMDENGVHYTLTVKTNYEFNGELCCQVTNISKDVICDVVVPDYISVGTDEKVNLPVRSIGENAFETAKINSVVLPETIREIKERAFLNCTNVRTVNVNGKLMATQSVQQFDEDGNPLTDDNGDYVYGEEVIKENLTAAGNTVDTTIGNEAFKGCTALTDVSISGMRTMGDSLFSGCSSLKNVSFSTDGMLEVASNSVRAYELSMKFGKLTFENCISMEEISLSKNIYILGAQAFKGCASLKRVNVGPTLSAYQGGLTLESFEGCTSMEKVSVDESNSYYSSFDGILYIGRTTSPSQLEYCPPCNNIESIELPKTVNQINDKAVMGNPYVKRLNVQSETDADGNVKRRVVYILTSAFEGCKALESLELGVQANIQTNAFKDCTALTNINHTYNAGTIGESAFGGCTALKNLNLYGWSKIESKAFLGCTGLETLTAGEGVGSIGNNCFEGCTSLRTVDLSMAGFNVDGATATTQHTFGTYVFKDCSALETADLPTGLLGVSTGTFQNCVKLETVTCGDNLGIIRNLAFDNCPSLVSPPSPRFLVRVQKEAFKGCTALKDYNITRSAIIFEDNAFVDCPNLVILAPDGSRAVEYAENNSIKYRLVGDDIRDEEFLIKDSSGAISGYRGGFETLTIPDDYFAEGELKVLGYRTNNNGTGNNIAWITNALAGADCSMQNYLKVLNLGPVEVLPQSTLSNSAVEEVDMPNVTTIYNSALQNCRSLKSLTVPSTVEAIGSQAFSSCMSLTDVVFEDGDGEIVFKQPVANKLVSEYTSDSNYIFSGCSALENVTFSDRVTYIPEYCFQNCTSLKAFNSSRAITEIRKYAFSGCTGLDTLRLSPLTERIRERAFQNCTSLTDVTLQHNTFLEKEAFYGCTNIERIIIPQTVNVAISNVPFINTYEATIVCAENSKGEEYAKAFNDPVSYAHLFNSESEANSYAGKYNYTIEYGEFLEGVEYVTVKGRISIPEGVIVKKDGNTVTNGSYVLGGDKLTFEVPQIQGQDTVLYINGEYVDYTKEYTVPENRNVEITLEYKELKGKLTIPQGVKVYKGDTELFDGDYARTGDELTFVLDNSDITKVPSLYINGQLVDSNGVYTVPADTDLVLTVKYSERMGRLTIPQYVKVYCEGEELVNGSYAEAGNQLTFTVETVNGQAGQLYVNGTAVNSAEAYTVPEGVNLVITVKYPNLKGEVTIPEGVTVYKNGELLTSGSYAAEGDRLTFELADEYKDGKLYINGVEFDVSGVYTVPADTDVVIRVSTLVFNYGDANADEKITAADAAEVLQKVLEASFVTGIETQGGDYMLSLDVSADGKLTAQDASVILQKTLDNSFVMPCEDK